MSIHARSTPNIALIKYWGNRNEEMRLPMADSLSVALDQPIVEIETDHADTLTVRSFDVDGTERAMTDKHLTRFEKHLSLTKQYLQKLGIAEALPGSVSLTIRSAIPPSIGIASSAAVFGCLAEAYAGIVAPVRQLTREEVSVIGRLGSGSACRGAFGGYVAITAGAGEDIDAAHAVQIADEHHWSLHDIIVVPTHEEKKYGSTEGHAFAHTSPLYKARIAAIPARQRECIAAILTRDFDRLRAVTEEDCLDMHAVMRTSSPSLDYLSDDTHRIIKDITQLRESEHLPVLYTMDAGPTVHLFCTDDAVKTVKDFAHAQPNCTIFEAKVGPGSMLF